MGLFEKLIGMSTGGGGHIGRFAGASKVDRARHTYGRELVNHLTPKGSAPDQSMVSTAIGMLKEKLFPH